jgi:hypothetical protein
MVALIVVWKLNDGIGWFTADEAAVLADGRGRIGLVASQYQASLSVK